MSGVLDLKNLEKRAVRSTYQDGLLDIQMGGIVASMAAWSYFDRSEGFPILALIIFLLGVLASQLIFWAGKKYISAPRLGQVKFGPQRLRRGRELAMVLAGIVLVQGIIVLSTLLLWERPAIAGTDRDLERLMVAATGALFVGPGVCLIAYFRDFPRGYYIAFILSLGVFAMIWFNQPIYMIAAGLLVIIPGVILLMRFLRKYPLPPQESSHD